MFYISIILAILGGVGYQYFVKLIPQTLNPIISILMVYVTGIFLCLLVLPFYPSEGGISQHIRQLNWIQVAIALSVLAIELGFLLMYRYGWNLTTTNVTTSVFTNLLLIAIGILILGEKVSPVNGIGIILSIIGVALIGYKPAQ